MTCILAVPQDDGSVILAWDGRVTQGDSFFSTTDKVTGWDTGEGGFCNIGMAGHDPTIGEIEARLRDAELSSCGRALAFDIRQVLLGVEAKQKHGVDLILVTSSDEDDPGPEGVVVYVLDTLGGLSGPVSGPVAIGSGAEAALAAHFADGEGPPEYRALRAVLAAGYVNLQVGPPYEALIVRPEDL